MEGSAEIGDEGNVCTGDELVDSALGTNIGGKENETRYKKNERELTNRFSLVMRTPSRRNTVVHPTTCFSSSVHGIVFSISVHALLDNKNEKCHFTA